MKHDQSFYTWKGYSLTVYLGKHISTTGKGKNTSLQTFLTQVLQASGNYKFVVSDPLSRYAWMQRNFVETDW